MKELMIMLVDIGRVIAPGVITLVGMQLLSAFMLVLMP